MQAEQAAQAAQAKDTPGSTKKSSSKTITDTVIGKAPPRGAAVPACRRRRTWPLPPGAPGAAHRLLSHHFSCSRPDVQASMSTPLLATAW